MGFYLGNVWSAVKDTNVRYIVLRVDPADMQEDPAVLVSKNTSWIKVW